MNFSYLVACGLLVTLFSEKMDAQPLTQAQQKVRQVTWSQLTVEEKYISLCTKFMLEDEIF